MITEWVGGGEAGRGEGWGAGFDLINLHTDYVE